MPRKPSDHLSVVKLPGKGRPEPPPGLSQSAQKIWRDIVDSTPDGFIDKAAQKILAMVVTQIGIANRQSERLELIAAKGGSIEDELMLAKAHRDAMRAATLGLTALRATPQARLRPGSTASAFERSPSGSRPWEWRVEVDGVERVPSGDSRR